MNEFAKLQLGTIASTGLNFRVRKEIGCDPCDESPEQNVQCVSRFTRSNLVSQDFDRLTDISMFTWFLSRIAKREACNGREKSSRATRYTLHDTRTRFHGAGLISRNAIRESYNGRKILTLNATRFFRYTVGTSFPTRSTN